MKIDEFEYGYANGFDEGREVGYVEGFDAASMESQKRISELKVQVATLEAQLSFTLGG